MIATDQLNQPAQKAQLDLCVRVLATVVEEGEALYLSAPITSGLRFLEWYKDRGRELDSNSSSYRKEHGEHVIEPNEKEVRNMARRLRQLKRCQVIDPAAFGAPGWSQDDYRYFWGRVLERYASKVVLMAGWEYSKGCTYEFLVAVQQGIPTLTQNDTPISLSGGRERIKAAILHMKSLGIKPDFNGNVLAIIDKLLAAS